MDETVLMRPVGGLDVMREQAEHLITMAERPNVTIQVVPLARGMHPGLRGSFSIMTFDHIADLTVYVESPSGNVLLDREKQVGAFTHTFNQLRMSALPADETLARLNRVGKGEPST